MSHLIGRGRYARETYPQSPGGASGGGSLLTPPVDVAAGSTVSMSHGGPNNFVGADGTAITYELPADGQPGDLAQIKMGGTGATPSIVTARGGATVEQVGDLGTWSGVNGSTSVGGQGTCVTFELDKSTASGANGRWNIKGVVSA